MNPLVSVILPNYNHARFLPQRIDSILAQTWRAFEFIALDDCSTDESREVLRSYAARTSMQLAFNEQNSGSPFRQWQRGLSMASGEYVWLAESDDVADPRLLETLLRQFDRYPTAGIAYCQSYSIDEHGTVSGPLDPWTDPVHPTRWHHDFFNSGPDEVANYLIQRNTVPNASAVLVRRSILSRAVEHADRMRLSGDWWAWARVLLASDVAFVAEPLNFFRSHPRTARDTTKLAIACAEQFEILAHICSQVHVAPDMRKRVFWMAFEKWLMVLEAQGTPSADWLWRVHADARRVFRGATPRMMWALTKRALRPHPRPVAS